MSDQEQFFDRADDMAWIRDVHLRGLAYRYKSAIVVGNEAWPKKIVVFDKKKPRYDEPGVTFYPDDSGKFHLAPGGLGPAHPARAAHVGGGAKGRKSSRASSKKGGGGAGASRITKRFRVGDSVLMNEDALSNYGERYRGQPLVVESVSTKYMPAKEFYAKGSPAGYHPGFDASSGCALYDLKGLGFSLYDWELE